jgi:2-polyprenyl-3-methyl-5-hydroxy-6-metoxy-1,4-benzoquinol methylase
MTCPICTSSQSKIYLESYHWRGTKEKFNIHQCDDCGHLYTKDAPSETAIGKYYDSENYISHNDDDSSLFNKLYSGVKKYMLAKKYFWISRFVPRGTIVDYGAGTGAFVKYIHDRGREAIGFELAEQGRKTAKERYNIDLREPSNFDELEKNSVSAISMWHVLEHLYDPTAFIRSCEEKISNNGILIIAVPNPLSLDAKIYKEHWAAFDLPIHVSHFKPEVMKKMVEKNNFKLIQTKALPIDPFYISLISNQNKYGKMKPLLAVINGLRSNLHGIATKNFSSMVYIFRKIEN